MDFCVQAAWRNGLSDAEATRALPATDILAGGTSDIFIDYADYPASIEVTCTENPEYNLTLTKGSSLCAGHTTYWTYTPSIMIKDKTIRHSDLRFTAYATIDANPFGSGDDLVGTFDSGNIHDGHMLINLHHTKALLRFAFKLDPLYDKVRSIMVTGITLNEQPGMVANKILRTDNHQFIAYAYVDPTMVTTSNVNTIKCTYNIYDKDAVFPDGIVADSDITDNVPHLTRKDVVAQNTFKLDNLKDSKDSGVSSIEAGYYYDLKVTLNPDYLYVLSEHDNKQHLKVE